MRNKRERERRREEYKESERMRKEREIDKVRIEEESVCAFVLEKEVKMRGKNSQFVSRTERLLLMWVCLLVSKGVWRSTKEMNQDCLPPTFDS